MTNQFEPNQTMLTRVKSIVCPNLHHTQQKQTNDWLSYDSEHSKCDAWLQIANNICSSGAHETLAIK